MRCVRGILLVVLTITMDGQLMAQDAATSGRTIDKNGVIHLEQNWKSGWDDSGKNWFHHASQGAMMVPYDTFMALEQPTTDPALPAMPLFSDPMYLSQFGFLRSEKDERYNPDNLPIGFAIAEKWDDPNTTAKDPIKALGLTCAACHTGEITYKGSRLRIEGGSAMINIGAFQQALSASVFITNSSTQKFEAFASRILGPRNLPPEIAAQVKVVLKRGLEAAVAKGMAEKKLETDLGLHTVDAGFSRTDALARIGNKVFGKLGSVNLSETDAPVNYPHLWDTPWFYWVQYNASIRLPMIRNIGEALGLGAAVNAADQDYSTFESTVNVTNLHLMEDYLAGEKPFTGLKAPAWPEDLLGEIQGFKEGNGQWQRGKQLYEAHCIDCHYRIEDYQTNLGVVGENDFWTTPNEFGRTFMKLPYINFVDIGTDPAAAVKFYRRIVYTGSLKGSKKSATMSGVDALTFATAKVRESEFKKLGLTDAQKNAYDGYRDLKSSDPGAVARLDYKARPLNGIWATAPFLHNGSVANLYELLLPAAQRSQSFYLGSVEFDPKTVGFDTSYRAGGFRIDTTVPGNLNSGHEFRNLTAQETAALTQFQREKLAEGMGWAVNGVLGPEFSEEDRWALIEYLKSLGSPQPQRIPQTAKVIGQEYPPDDEWKSIRALVKASSQMHRATGIGMRGQHQKQHGAVFARFRVEPNIDLPEDARVGLFRTPKEYTAIIRFSNGESFIDSGTDENGRPIVDVRGMAIKVLVPSTDDPTVTVSQDFVTANSETFFAKNVADLAEFVKEMIDYKTARGVAAENLSEDKEKLRETLGSLDKAYFGLISSRFPMALKFKSPAPPSLLQATYWSETPYKLGPKQVVKYVVAPGDSNTIVPTVDQTSPDFLKKAMAEQLTHHKIPSSFDFCIQLQTDADTMPIEDPTVAWTSPRIKVATITIFPQKFDSEAQMKFCENLSFSPWQTLPEHAPLGGINRVRKSIYDASSEMRHGANRTERKEPTGRESF